MTTQVPVEVSGLLLGRGWSPFWGSTVGPVISLTDLGRVAELQAFCFVFVILGFCFSPVCGQQGRPHLQAPSSPLGAQQEGDPGRVLSSLQ